MDLDKQISELEGKTSFINLGSKAIFVRIGISLVISSFLIYKSKSLIVFNAEYDQNEDDIKLNINYKNFIIVTIIFAFVLFFLIGYIPYFK
jgi:hypothetical protein